MPEYDRVRDRIFATIRAAQKKPSASQPRERESALRYIEQHPQGPRPKSDWEPIQRFRERALSVSSTVDEVSSMNQAPQAIAKYMRENGLSMQAVCWPELGSIDWGSAGIRVEPRRAEGTDLVGITGAFCGIAETGTLMLLSGPRTPATVSLFPETHIAVLPVSRLVKGMEEAWALLRAERGQLPRAVNFVSGPSCTGDIEMVVVRGAHGPYRVHVILVRETGTESR
jgi:L-lactate dehydrogenase complex protein LldG